MIVAIASVPARVCLVNGTSLSQAVAVGEETESLIMVR